MEKTPTKQPKAWPVTVPYTAPPSVDQLQVIHKEISEGASTASAAKTIGMKPSQLRAWAAEIPEIQQIIEDAEKDASDLAYQELYRRAVYGTQRTVYHMGVAVGQQQEYDNRALLRLLEAVMPEKFKPGQELVNLDIGDILTKAHQRAQSLAVAAPVPQDPPKD